MYKTYDIYLNVSASKKQKEATLIHEVILGLDEIYRIGLDELEEGHEVPKASDYDAVEKKEGGQVNMILLEQEALLSKAIK